MKTLLVSLALVTILSGCGPTREAPAIVRGQVLHKGKPVTKAVIYFEKEGEDYSVFAELDKDGAFQIKTHDYGGLPAGSYKIAVKPYPEAMTALVGDEKKQAAHPLIPLRFLEAEKSGLRATVQKGENPLLSFDLGKDH